MVFVAVIFLLAISTTKDNQKSERLNREREREREQLIFATCGVLGDESDEISPSGRSDIADEISAWGRVGKERLGGRTARDLENG